MKNRNEVQQFTRSNLQLQIQTPGRAAGVSRAGTRTGFQFPGHGNMQGFNCPSRAGLLFRIINVSCGGRAHAQVPAIDPKSIPLDFSGKLTCEESGAASAATNLHNKDMIPETSSVRHTQRATRGNLVGPHTVKCDCCEPRF